MTKINLEIHDDVIKTINKIKAVNDSGVELYIPEGSILFDNILNLKLIDQQAETLGKSVQFSTEDEAGNSLISSLEGRSESIFQPGEILEETTNTKLERTRKIQMTLPQINFKLPRINFSGKPFLLFLAVPIILIAIVYLLIGTKTPKALAKIILYSDPWTRSITVKVKLNTETNQDGSILRGNAVETTMQSNGEADTTGEKLIGEKAKGDVVIYNKSSDEITLKKGTELLYEESDKSYKFVLDGEVEIPASHQQSSDPGSPIIPGEKATQVTAQDIGSGYNIDKDKSLEISKYKKSVLEAKSKDDFEGGKADKVKIVNETDRTNLSKKLLEQNTSGIEIALKSKLTSPNKLIPGAHTISVTKESFSHKVGDEAEKITLEQVVTISGLSYSDTDLNTLINKVIDKMAPEGYSLSKKDWSVKVEPLGNSTSSVLSSTEADMQITIKTSVIPNVDKEEIRKSISGKSLKEAEKILGSIKNVREYSLKVSPAIPLFKKVPKDLNRIELVIENE